jgi:hypothetical protein
MPTIMLAAQAAATPLASTAFIAVGRINVMRDMDALPLFLAGGGPPPASVENEREVIIWENAQ